MGVIKSKLHRQASLDPGGLFHRLTSSSSAHTEPTAPQREEGGRRSFRRYIMPLRSSLLCGPGSRDEGEASPDRDVVRVHRRFQVTCLDERLHRLVRGSLEVTVTELIFVFKQMSNSLSYRWPISALRTFGCTDDIFTFECGRCCPGGEGFYLFKCKKARQLSQQLQNQINRLMASDFRRYDRESSNFDVYPFPVSGRSSREDAYAPLPRIAPASMQVLLMSSQRPGRGAYSHRHLRVPPDEAAGGGSPGASLLGESAGGSSRSTSAGSGYVSESGRCPHCGFTLGQGCCGEYLIAAPEPPDRHSYVNQPSQNDLEGEVAHPPEHRSTDTVYAELDINGMQLRQPLNTLGLQENSAYQNYVNVAVTSASDAASS